MRLTFLRCAKPCCGAPLVLLLVWVGSATGEDEHSIPCADESPVLASVEPVVVAAAGGGDDGGGGCAREHQQYVIQQETPFHT